MNIFKVLASGKQSFHEEIASAILAWFLNPTMEHGLGYSFLVNFIEDIYRSADKSENLFDLSEKLIPRLRNKDDSQLKLWSDLEYNVGTAFIDIVIGIEDWIFAIENKIYNQSATKGQLVREYEGLKDIHPDLKIAMIYLVPTDDNLDILDAKTENIFNELSGELSHENGDFKALITWQKNKLENIPSISDLIEKILDDESKGVIDPVPEYTRHTLKALNSFIFNNFAGYEYDRVAKFSGLNPLTEERMSIDKLENKDKGYVGVQGGTGGLLRMTKGKIESYKFQYSSQDMSKKSNWVEINAFQNIIKWLLLGEVVKIDWKGSFNSETLYKVANSYKGNVFIGIKGGEEALRNMNSKIIEGKKWGISTEKSTSQWIDGVLFCEILKEKGVFN